MKKQYSKIILILWVILFTASSCSVKDKKTTLAVVDADRHYYSVMRGKTIDVVYEIENTGENPLFITDIHASCGCILIDSNSTKVLPAGGKGFVRLKYDSSKNLGYVKHYISIYANLESDKTDMTFDLHVVPNALYTQDYEELFEENQNALEELEDKEEIRYQYYVDDAP